MKLKIIILIICGMIYYFPIFSQTEIGIYSEIFTGKFIDKNSFSTSKNNITIGGGFKIGVDLPKKFQFEFGMGYNRYTNRYENSKFDKQDNFKNENYETQTTLNTTLNGFYSLDFLKFNLRLNYPILKIKEKSIIFVKMGVSFSQILNGYEEFQINVTEKGRLFYQDSIYPIDRTSNEFFVANKKFYDYPNSVNIELLIGIGANYNFYKNHSFFTCLDLNLGVFNNYYLNDRYERYTNTSDKIRSFGIGIKFGYAHRFNVEKDNLKSPQE